MPFLGDAEFLATVESIKKNPSLLPGHLQDNRIQALLQALLLQNNPDIMRKEEEEMLKKRKEREKAEEEVKRREAEKKAAKEVRDSKPLLGFRVEGLFV